MRSDFRLGPARVYRLRGGLCLVLLLAVGFAVSRPGIDNPWFWDDLHLVRPYSLGEIAQTWHGPWDPDGVETPGYRPLQTLSHAARFALLGESPAANRYLTVASIAVAFALFALAFQRLGVPLTVTTAAGVIAFSAKDMAYTYAWVSDSYHALQGIAFAVTLVGLFAAARAGPRRAALLWTSVAGWAVTLLLKDQAVVLLPVLLAAVLYARILGAPTRSYPEGYAALARRARFECAGLRRQRHLAIYVAAITAMTVVELVVRRVFVPEAEAPALDWGALHSVLRELKYTIALGGQEHLGAYVALAGAAVIVVLVAPGFAQARPAVTRLWLLATFAAFGTISSALFALIVSRSDLVFFPLWFYALFLCAAVAIVLRLVWPLRRLRAVSLAVLVLLSVLSGLASVRGGSAIQHSMGPRSELTLTFDYDFVYGRYARAATIPSRRAEMVKRVLRGVQIPGPVMGNDVRSPLLGRGLGSYPDVVRRDPNGFFSDDGH